MAEQSRGAALLDPRVDLDALAADPDARAALRAGTLPLPLYDEGVLPRTVAQLRACEASFADELAVGDQGLDMVRFLLRPPLPAPILAGYVPVLAGAVATLPAAQRRLLGIPGPDLAFAPLRANTRALLAAFRFTTGRSPSAQAAHDRAAA